MHDQTMCYRDLFPLGALVRKISGPEWHGVVVGHYSSSFTPEGLVIECTAEGARGQVHVEPAKRMERMANGLIITRAQETTDAQ